MQPPWDVLSSFEPATSAAYSPDSFDRGLYKLCKLLRFIASGTKQETEIQELTNGSLRIFQILPFYTNHVAKLEANW